MTMISVLAVVMVLSNQPVRNITTLVEIGEISDIIMNYVSEFHSLLATRHIFPGVGIRKAGIVVLHAAMRQESRVGPSLGEFGQFVVP